MVTATHFETREDEQIVRKMGQAVQDVNSGFCLSLSLFFFFHVKCGFEAPEKDLTPTLVF